MITEERARELRQVIESVMSEASDEVAASAPELFPSFDPDGHTYVADDRFRYEGNLYKVIQGHTSQADWLPNNATSLYARVLIETDENGEQISIPEWEQPDSTNAYAIGDKVMFEGEIYESLINNNVWSPSTYPSGWNKI